ncbi:two-component system response regulator YesN [Virgibacillus halotolerans]|uniref:response regulator transcription factor n=1 Tax=Virgibacillus halotolerans TaxID=1071053 RepID=UPI001961DEDF|nr:response regulator [Virgibacillus halotolerans]MBM7599192.1 two-component system response regulator YesN [Virgibacillus halotolerans]
MYKVLIVEDESIIRKGLSYKVNWLENNCFVVGNAADGKDGLIKIKELKPDIVITDIRMPFKDGIQMLEESLHIYDYEAIIISGYSEFDYARQAISLGVNEYLLKPIDFSKLNQVICKLILKIEVKDKANVHEESLGVYSELLNVDFYERDINRSKLVFDILTYIQSNFSRKITLNDLSEQYSLSTVYLNNKFKEETNYTINDFLNRYRILKAIEMLKRDDMLIYEIAELVGFQNYKYFSQVFKKYVGASPTLFIGSLG